MNLWNWLFQRRAREKDLDEEVQAHLRMAVQDRIAQGESAEKARASAAREFGNDVLVKETTRDLWGFVWLETLLQDLRYGLRQLKRNPGFTAVAIITLALGIGANTAIFSVVNAALLEPLPLHEPDRLIQLWGTAAAPGNYPLSGGDYFDWQAQNQTLASTSLYSWSSTENLSGVGEAEAVRTVQTQANFFSTVGAGPLLGRAFGSGEDEAGRNQVAVLSYGFWQEHFGGRSSAIGKTIELDGRPYQIVGVMPRWFNFPDGTELWTPLDMSGQFMTNRGGHRWRAVARMKPGVTPQQAQADLTAIEARLAKLYPNDDKDIKAIAIPLQEELTHDSRSQLFILLGAVALVLLIACANLANLLLARSTSRQREIAVRSALGAGRWRLARQLLTESVVLALAGAAMGLAAAWWLILWAQENPNLPIPRAHPLTMDGRVLLFTFTLSVLVGILFGLAPAVRLSGSPLAEELKASANAVLSPARASRWIRDALVVLEFALSLALLTGAGLLLRTFVNLRGADIGVRTSGLLTANFSLPESRYADTSARRALLDGLLEKIQHTPGIESAALSWNIPLEGGTNGTVTVPGNNNPALSRQLVECNFVSPDYFRVYAIPFIQGRNFTSADAQRAVADAEQLLALYKAAKGDLPKLPDGISIAFPAIVSRAMVQTFWPNQDPIGKAFQGVTGPSTVIGVVGDVRQIDIRTPARPEAYYPLPVGLSWAGLGSITVQTPLDPLSLASAVRNDLRSVDAQLALSRPRTMRKVVSDHMQGTNFESVLLGLFAGLAVLLAALGIYGVMAYLVAQRAREFGIRMAFGAGRLDILRLVLVNGCRLIFIGFGAGLLAVLALTRILTSELYGVSPTDPVTFAAVSVVLVAIALAACLIPAHRAIKVDPMVALRYE